MVAGIAFAVVEEFSGLDVKTHCLKFIRDRALYEEINNAVAFTADKVPVGGKVAVVVDESVGGFKGIDLSCLCKLA